MSKENTKAKNINPGRINAIHDRIIFFVAIKGGGRSCLS
jgi:hypothetical protein